MKIYKGYWYTTLHCNNCSTELSDDTVMYSNGRCPHCGVKGSNAGTIINHYERATRTIYKLWLGFIPIRIGIETKDN